MNEVTQSAEGQQKADKQHDVNIRHGIEHGVEGFEEPAEVTAVIGEKIVFLHAEEAVLLRLTNLPEVIAAQSLNRAQPRQQDEAADYDEPNQNGAKRLMPADQADKAHDQGERENRCPAEDNQPNGKIASEQALPRKRCEQVIQTPDHGFPKAQEHA